MGEIVGKVNGTKIDGVNIHHENLSILTKDGRRYFMKPSQLVGILNEFVFEAEFKRTRTWLHPVTPDVDLLYHPENYPDES